MASNSKEQIVVEGRKVGEFFDKALRDDIGVRARWTGAFNNTGLSVLRKDILWEIAQPSLKHGAHNVDIVKVGLLKEIQIEFYSLLVMFL